MVGYQTLQPQKSIRGRLPDDRCCSPHSRVDHLAPQHCAVSSEHVEDLRLRDKSACAEPFRVLGLELAEKLVLGEVVSDRVERRCLGIDWRRSAG